MSDAFLEASAQFIRKAEGFSNKAYVDASGQSIGYGHFIKPGEDDLRGRRLTKTEAENLLIKDIAQHQKPWIATAQKMGLDQNQIVALTSFAYNTGGAAIPRVLAKIRAGDLDGASEIMASYNKAYNPQTGRKEVYAALVSRRETEIDILRKGRGGLLDSLGLKNPPDAVFGGSSAIEKLNKRTRGISEIIDGFKGKSAKGMLAQTGGEIALGEYNAVAGELAGLAARLGQGSGDSEWMDSLRKEGMWQWGVR